MGWRNSQRHRGHDQGAARGYRNMHDGQSSISFSPSKAWRAAVVRAAGCSASAGHGAPPVVPSVKHGAWWQCEQQATLHLSATSRASPCDGTTRRRSKRRDGWWSERRPAPHASCLRRRDELVWRMGRRRVDHDVVEHKGLGQRWREARRRPCSGGDRWGIAGMERERGWRLQVREDVLDWPRVSQGACFVSLCLCRRTCRHM
jgi:hypothetical protein